MVLGATRACTPRHGKNGRTGKFESLARGCRHGAPHARYVTTLVRYWCCCLGRQHNSNTGGGAASAMPRGKRETACRQASGHPRGAHVPTANRRGKFERAKFGKCTFKCGRVARATNGTSGRFFGTYPRVRRRDRSRLVNEIDFKITSGFTFGMKYSSVELELIRIIHRRA